MIGGLNRSAWVRIAPFAVFMLLLLARGELPADAAWGIDARWIYGVTVVAVGGLLVVWRREYGELFAQTLPSVREALAAVAVGLFVCWMWVRLDAAWMTLGTPTARFVPTDAAGGIDWPLVAVRWIGAALVVPVMEELFWRSYLMRWIRDPRFETVQPGEVGVRAVVLSTFVFTLAHTLWLGAVIAGLAYALLYVRTAKLWTAVLAHAVTNGALGIWVVATRNWQFW